MIQLLCSTEGNCEERMIDLGSVQIWTEAFGKKDDPALLLIMAAGGQGIMWPTLFCEQLAKKGFYVIRYDHRDMGLSTAIEYQETPYDLMDLAQDAIGILDAMKLPKAHIIGLSMGGSLAAILSREFSHRIETMTMINSTSDLTTFLDPTDQNITLLPKPKSDFLAWIEKRNATIKLGVSFDEKVALFTESWKLLNASEATFDEPLYRSLVVQSLSRSKNPNGFGNHMQAMKASIGQLKIVLENIQTPCLIVHGTESPIFSREHALDLASKIPGARLEFIKGMGHILSPFFYKTLQDLIVSHLSVQIAFKETKNNREAMEAARVG